jgi:hypothetical protein
MRSIEVLHEMGALQILHKPTTPSGSKGLDRKHLSLFHSGGVSICPAERREADEMREWRSGGDGWRTVVHRNTFPSMDPMRLDRVSTETSDSFDRVGLAIDGHLVRLHHLLDRLSNLRHLDIDAGTANPRVGGIFDSSEEVIELRIKCNSPCTVNDPTWQG